MSTTLNDCRFDELRLQGFTGATNDMLLQWAQAGGATSGQLNDALLEYLLLSGGVTPALNDAWFEALLNAGYLGTRNDMEHDFWCDGGAVAPPASVVGAYPLRSTLEGVVDGAQAFANFTRAAGPSSVEDFEDIIHSCKDGEARFWRARRVENFIEFSEPLEGTDAGWLVIGGATYTGGVLTLNDSGENLQTSPAIAASIGEQYVVSLDVTLVSEVVPETPIRIIIFADGGAQEITQQINPDLVTARYEIPFTATVAAGFYLIQIRGVTADQVVINIANVQMERITGTQTLASEYVSTGVLSSPWNGANVDGVQYFETFRTGVSIPLEDLKGIMVESGNPAFDGTAMGTLNNETLNAPSPLALQSATTNDVRMLATWEQPIGGDTIIDNYILEVNGVDANQALAMTMNSTEELFGFKSVAGALTSVIQGTGLGVPAPYRTSIEMTVVSGLTSRLNGAPKIDPDAVSVDLSGGTNTFFIGCRASDGLNQLEAGIKNVLIAAIIP